MKEHTHLDSALSGTHRALLDATVIAEPTTYPMRTCHVLISEYHTMIMIAVISWKMDQHCQLVLILGATVLLHTVPCAIAARDFPTILPVPVGPSAHVLFEMTKLLEII